ncbi:hypothetical protein KM043_009448 [Ampulex compressa]|nr:hypothetical protein KM043_009448 [Ampulex compressa]
MRFERRTSATKVVIDSSFLRPVQGLENVIYAQMQGRDEPDVEGSPRQGPRNIAISLKSAEPKEFRECSRSKPQILEELCKRSKSPGREADLTSVLRNGWYPSLGVDAPRFALRRFIMPYRTAITLKSFSRIGSLAE